MPFAWQVIVASTQVWPWSQAEPAHESPGAGGGAQVPQTACARLPQNAVAHCPLNPHGWPVAIDPAGVQLSGSLPSK
jgi:hypothetical protein